MFGDIAHGQRYLFIQMQRWTGILILFVLLAVVSLEECSFDFETRELNWDELAEDGIVAVMVHPDVPGSDAIGIYLDDCTTQANLDDVGKEHVREMGKTLRAHGISFDEIWTSQYCRTIETAELLELGSAKPLPELNWDRGQDYSTMITRAERVREKFFSLPAGTRVLLVTHPGNLSWIYAKRVGVEPGEIVVLKDDNRLDQMLSYEGRMTIVP